MLSEDSLDVTDDMQDSEESLVQELLAEDSGDEEALVNADHLEPQELNQAPGSAEYVSILRLPVQSAEQLQKEAMQHSYQETPFR